MAVYLATFSGTLLNGAEQFSHSLAIDDVLGGSEEDMLAQVVLGLQAMTGFTGFAATYPQSTKWTNVKVAQVLNLSTGELRAGINQAVNISGTGSGVAVIPPPQVAVAVSLVAGPRANGTPFRGRFYLPAPAVASSNWSEGLMTATAQATIANGVEAMLEQINDPIDQIACQVWSRRYATTSTVETIRVGRAFDTIRSRRRDLAELYVDRAIS